MVITEYLTKYPYAVPVRTKTAEEISRKLWIFITMFGPPKIMGSDKGKEFVNQLVTQLCNACGIEHKVTSAYHPQANGHTEKFNDTLINMLKKHAEENPDDWDKWLPFVLLAYRTRVHTTTGHTPFELMFGRTMNEFDDYSFTQDPVNERIIEIKQMV
jgi:transposase InsO family protein